MCTFLQAAPLWPPAIRSEFETVGEEKFEINQTSIWIRTALSAIATSALASTTPSPFKAILLVIPFISYCGEKHRAVQALDKIAKNYFKIEVSENTPVPDEVIDYLIKNFNALKKLLEDPEIQFDPSKKNNQKLLDKIFETLMEIKLINKTDFIDKEVRNFNLLLEKGIINSDNACDYFLKFAEKKNLVPMVLLLQKELINPQILEKNDFIAAFENIELSVIQDYNIKKLFGCMISLFKDKGFNFNDLNFTKLLNKSSYQLENALFLIKKGINPKQIKFNKLNWLKVLSPSKSKKTIIKEIKRQIAADKPIDADHPKQPFLEKIGKSGVRFHQRILTLGNILIALAAVLINAFIAYLWNVNVPLVIGTSVLVAGLFLVLEWCVRTYLINQASDRNIIKYNGVFPSKVITRYFINNESALNRLIASQSNLDKINEHGTTFWDIICSSKQIHFPKDKNKDFGFFKKIAGKLFQEEQYSGNKFRYFRMLIANGKSKYIGHILQNKLIELNKKQKYKIFGDLFEKKFLGDVLTKHYGNGNNGVYWRVKNKFDLSKELNQESIDEIRQNLRKYNLDIEDKKIYRYLENKLSRFLLKEYKIQKGYNYLCDFSYYFLHNKAALNYILRNNIELDSFLTVACFPKNYLDGDTNNLLREGFLKKIIIRIFKSNYKMKLSCFENLAKLNNVRSIDLVKYILNNKLIALTKNQKSYLLQIKMPEELKSILTEYPVARADVGSSTIQTQSVSLEPDKTSIVQTEVEG